MARKTAGQSKPVVAATTPPVEETPVSAAPTDSQAQDEILVNKETTSGVKQVQVKYLVSGESRIFGKLYRYEKEKSGKLRSDVAGILQNSGKLAIIT